ncbi:MAG: hypothetical protein ACTILC_06945 [Oceanisphaera sp.]
MSILKNTTLIVGALLVLSGCATAPGECQAWDDDASLITKMRCDALAKDKTGYGGEVRAKEQELHNAQLEKELLEQVYQDILVQQADTKLTLNEQRIQQQQLDKSLGRLLQKLKGRHGDKSSVQQQISELESEMAALNSQDLGNDPAAIAQKKAELENLRKKVSRLQMSLGY